MKYVYKIVSALCALAVFPFMIFLPMIYYFISSTALEGIFMMGQALGYDTFTEAMTKYGLESVPKGIASDMSVYYILNLVNRFSDSSLISDEINETLGTIVPSFIATIIAVAFTIITAIVIIILVFACKDNRKVIATSFAGIGFSLMIPMLFDNAVSPLINGEITLSQLAGNEWISLLADVDVITLNSTFYFIPITFGFIALWTILYNATLPEKEKEERKKLIG